MLGSAICREFTTMGEVVGVGRAQLNIEDTTEIQRCLSQVAPDLVIHCAAIADVELCERDPQLSERVNLTATAELLTALPTGARFVFISSTGVYGEGQETPWSETNPPHPTTVYHRHKYAAEQLVLAKKNSLVVRTGWLFSNEAQHRKNFVIHRLRELTRATEVVANADQRGSPTHVDDLARQIAELVRREAGGIYNAVGAGPAASRYEYVRAIAQAAKSACRVTPVPASHFNRRAPVPSNESASNQRLETEGLATMRDWREALSEAVTKLQRSPPRVTVLMNCYNGARFLEEALASVQAQTFTDWEILFIDNGSTDNSSEIAQHFKGRLRLLRTPHHMTLYGARDFALPHVDSEFLAFLDTDDIWEADKLERQLAAVAKHQVDFVCGGARVLLQSEGKRLFTKVWDDRFIDFSLMAARYMINIQTVLLRTSRLGELRFDPRLLIAGDYLFFLRYLQRNTRAYF